MAVDIYSINLERRLALLDDDAVVPITNMFDADGVDTDDPAEAFTFVCGRHDCWLSAKVGDFAIGETTTH